MRQVVRLLWTIVVLFSAALAPVAVAQITTTAVRGIVRDPSNAVIPNVNLRLRDTATGIEQTTSSGPDGGFIFANMPSGKYTLTASMNGFQNATYSNIVIDSGRTTDVSVQM